MYRSIVLHDIPVDAMAPMERWYWAVHSPEIVRRYGPWSARHDSWLPVDTPSDARAWGYHNWRLTEGWWRALPAPGPRGAFSFTPPPVWPTVAACFTPWQPTEDFVGSDMQPGQLAPLRWLVMLRYPRSSQERAEHWFLTTFAPTASRMPGLRRFFSYQTLDPGPLPGTWPQGAHPPAGSFHPGWDRVCEFWFENFSEWRRFVAAGKETLRRPDWATAGQFPYLEPHSEIVSTFLLERPADEFLRDARAFA